MAAAVTQCRYSFPDKAELQQRITRDALYNQADWSGKKNILKIEDKIDRIIHSVISSIANLDDLSAGDVNQVVNEVVDLYLPGSASKLSRLIKGELRRDTTDPLYGLIRTPLRELLKSAATKIPGGSESIKEREVEMAVFRVESMPEFSSEEE